MQLWLKLMRLGKCMGCHQRPDRSFFIRGFQLPVCARCTGILAGYIVGIFIWKYWSFTIGCAIALCVPMLIDGGTQYMELRESTQGLRIATGFLGGVGIMELEIMLILKSAELWRSII